MVPGRYCELGRHLQEVHRACAAAMCPDHSHHFWEVPWCFTYRNITDRLGISGFYRPMDHGKFQLGIPIKLNNPELRVLCPVFVGQTSTFFSFPSFLHSATYSKGDRWDLQGHSLWNVQGHHWSWRNILGGFGGAVRSVHILRKRLGSNFSLQIPSNFMETLGF